MEVVDQVAELEAVQSAPIPLLECFVQRLQLTPQLLLVSPISQLAQETPDSLGRTVPFLLWPLNCMQIDAVSTSLPLRESPKSNFARYFPSASYPTSPNPAGPTGSTSRSIAAESRRRHRQSRFPSLSAPRAQYRRSRTTPATQVLPVAQQSTFLRLTELLSRGIRFHRYGNGRKPLALARPGWLASAELAHPAADLARCAVHRVRRTAVPWLRPRNARSLSSTAETPTVPRSVVGAQAVGRRDPRLLRHVSRGRVPDLRMGRHAFGPTASWSRSMRVQPPTRRTKPSAGRMPPIPNRLTELLERGLTLVGSDMREDAVVRLIRTSKTPSDVLQAIFATAPSPPQMGAVERLLPVLIELWNTTPRPSADGATPTEVVEDKSNRAERPGRNDPCPCGSGAKYKRCCLARSVY